MDAATPVNERLDPLNLAVGARLEALRAALGYSAHGQLKHFARQISVKSNHYSMIESGERPLQPAVALRIKQVFGATLDWLYGGDESGLPDRLRRALHASITEM